MNLARKFLEMKAWGVLLLWWVGSALSPVFAQSQEEKAFYHLLQCDVAKTLSEQLSKRGGSMTGGQVFEVVDGLFKERYKNFSDLEAFDAAKKRLRDAFYANEEALSRGSSENLGLVVNRYLVNVLEKSAYEPNPYVDSRFLLGTTSSHTKDGLKSVFTASALVRTRFYDPRGKITRPLRVEEEKWFIDLLVDADFITNTPFLTEEEPGDAAGDSSAGAVPGQSSAELLLSSARSSKLSLGTFFAVPPRLSDWGAVGIIGRFEISTEEGSDDLFRRMVWGVRMENRSETIIRGASLEVALAPDRAIGSLDLNEKQPIFGAERVVLALELPITGMGGSRQGLYAQFRGEWPIGDKKDRKKGLEDKLQKFEEVTKPIYQFRLGAVFDPNKIFGPLFAGLGPR